MKVKLKMHTEGLNFLKVQKFKRAKINEHMLKSHISHGNKSRLLNNEVLGFKYGFKIKNVLHMNKDGGVNMVV